MRKLISIGALLSALFLCDFTLLLSEEPWGKDSSLASEFSCKVNTSAVCQTPFLGKFGEAGIRFHQEVISPIDGPRSHFLPSSSQYTLEAMRKYGFFKGFMRGCDRLMRENEDPWVYRISRNGGGQKMKWDPVR